MIDIVTVFHNNKNKRQAEELHNSLLRLESDFTFYAHSNIEENVGFAKACNIGAFREGAKAPVIGFLNPDVTVSAPFIHLVQEVFDKEPNTVITGHRFGKPKGDLRIWRVQDWVCGAAFFVRRDWFMQMGGFDEKYVWSWEETDLIKAAQSQGRRVHSIELPITHESPVDDSEIDSEYKQTHFRNGQLRYAKKWGRK